MGHHIRKQFSITDWYGKQFPSDCLEYPELEFYCDHLRAIPPHCPVNYDLSAHLPIQDFLSLAFPSHSHSLVVEAASKSFSNNLPGENPASLIKRDIPPQQFIRDAKSQFGQAVLDRQRSIKDPLYDKSFLPFWVITLWERLMELNAAKEEWSTAVAWFQRLSKTLVPTMSAATKKHLTRTGWGARITIGQEQATALTLTQLLADARLNSAILDLMAECTQVELSCDEPTPVHVCGTLFGVKVAQLSGAGSEEPPDWFRKRFINPVKENQWKTLYFPLYWPKYKHWVAVKVNFRARKISIGQYLTCLLPPYTYASHSRFM